MKQIRILTLSLLFIVMAINTNAQLKLLSGLEGGTYEVLANDIKNASTQKVEVLTSKGSVYNFEQLINNDNDIFVAFIQYDVLIHNEMLKPELRKDLRVLLPLFLDEEVHIIAKKDSGIKNIIDLAGKRVAVGEPGMGTFVSANIIKEATGIDWEDVAMTVSDAHKALEKGEIDAYFYVGGAPISTLANLDESVEIQLVSINYEGLENVYSKKEIKEGTYKWQSNTVMTFAVPTVLVCNVHDMSLDTRRKLNTLLNDTKNGLKKFQSNGHEKWKDVYTKSHSIDWPYYYLKPIVE